MEIYTRFVDQGEEIEYKPGFSAMMTRTSCIYTRA